MEFHAIFNRIYSVTHKMILIIPKTNLRKQLTENVKYFSKDHFKNINIFML